MIRYGKNVLGVYGERVAGFKRSDSVLVIRNKSGTSLVAEVGEKEGSSQQGHDMYELVVYVSMNRVWMYACVYTMTNLLSTLFVLQKPR